VAPFQNPRRSDPAGYDAGKFDEFIPASIIGDYAGMADGDAVLCFNFRADGYGKSWPPCSIQHSTASLANR